MEEDNSTTSGTCPSPNGHPSNSVDEANPMRWARKPWNHLGLFTRQEAVQLLADRFVSQKRRVQMRDCVRIIYYCHVQRSRGCRYEMSVCVPKDPEEKLRIDDYNKHTCNLKELRKKRRTRPHIEDFDRPLEKRRSNGLSTSSLTGKDYFCLGESVATLLHGIDQQHTDPEVLNSEPVAPIPSTSLVSTSDGSAESWTIYRMSIVWKIIDIDIIDFTNRPDGTYNYVFHAIDRGSRYSHAVPLSSTQPEVVTEALINMFYQFGPAASIYLELCFKGTTLISKLQKIFPSITIQYHAQLRNANNQILPRREKQLMKDRILAWMLEKEVTDWSKQLPAIKYSHNSEWMEEIESTPMDFFFGRCDRRDAGFREDDALSDSLTINSNEQHIEN